MPTQYTLPCATCGKPFRVWRCELPTKRWCSKPCYDAAQTITDVGAHLLAHRRIDGQTGCWEWTGGRDDDGYGKTTVAGQFWRVHRLAYTHYCGPIPPGLLVCHTCDNPPCFYPDHLFAGTQGDNSLDRDAKWHLPHGEAHHRAKLTAERVRAIRALARDGVRHRAIAERFGISIDTVRSIVIRRAWRHVA